MCYTGLFEKQHFALVANYVQMSSRGMLFSDGCGVADCTGPVRWSGCVGPCQVCDANTSVALKDRIDELVSGLQV